MITNIRNERGVALMIGLTLIVVLVPLTGIIVLRTVRESVMVKKERDTSRAFFIAESGALAGLDKLDGLINTDMDNTLNAMSPTTVISTALTHLDDGVQFLLLTVKENGVAQLTLNETQAEYAGNNTNFGDGAYQFKILLREKSDPVTINSDTWDFPYNFQVTSMGVFNGIVSRILLSGDFTARVQRDSFARYALFTNQQTLADGTTNVWFTGNTNFAGPIHTNGRYNIYGNPSGTFEGIVTQQEQSARFYNNGSSILLDADFNGTRDVPTFHEGFDRGVDAIALSSEVQKQDLIDQAKGGEAFPGNGIFVANNGTTLTGGIYVNGDSTINMSVDANNNAVYSITHGGAGKIITVNQINNQTTVDAGGGGSTVYQSVPDGIDNMGSIIFVDGNVTSLNGTVQGNTE